MADSQTADTKPKRRRWLTVLCALLAVVVLFGGWLCLERYRGKAALAKYASELKAKGERLSFTELSPPVPEGENKFPEFIRLGNSLQDGQVLMLNSPPARPSWLHGNYRGS